MNIPTREARNKAWNCLMRQSEYLNNVADDWRYGTASNKEAARLASNESAALREVADWLREDHGDTP